MLLEIDLQDEDTIRQAADAFGSGPLDMLINVEGTGHSVPAPLSHRVLTRFS